MTCLHCKSRAVRGTEALPAVAPTICKTCGFTNPQSGAISQHSFSQFDLVKLPAIQQVHCCRIAHAPACGFTAKTLRVSPAKSSAPAGPPSRPAALRPTRQRTFVLRLVGTALRLGPPLTSLAAPVSAKRLCESPGRNLRCDLALPCGLSRENLAGFPEINPLAPPSTIMNCASETAMSLKHAMCASLCLIQAPRPAACHARAAGRLMLLDLSRS